MAITEEVPTKSIKRNSIGLPTESRELIRQKRHQRQRDTRGKGPEYRSTRQTIIVYRNELVRILLSERETTGKCTATIWSFPRFKMPPGVKSGQSAPYNHPTLVSRDEGGIKTRSVTTTEKLETFTSQLEGVFTNEIENNVFDEEVKTNVDAELDQPLPEQD